MKYSNLPSISELIQYPAIQDVEHSFAVRIARDCVAAVRRQIAAEKTEVSIDWNSVLQAHREQISMRKYKRVINGTGIVIHTNLGRAPMAAEVLEYVQEVSSGYCNLELRLANGKRGGRLSGIQTLLTELTGAQAALAVNNNADATMLILSAVAAGKEVIVSRGELVEIGGSFRIPDVISNGGATLVEVGTTNRTTVQDYERAITENTGALLRVHPSNYRVVGFSKRAPRKELAQLAKKYNIPLIDDLGSGLLGKIPKVSWARELEEEESIKRAIADGVDVITFSGDKLLGGPQSGMIVGRKDLVQACMKHPLYRALRLDKLALTALEGTLQIYREGREGELPIWQCLERTEEECLDIAQKLAELIPGAIVERSEAFSGGGALPDRALPSYMVVITGEKPMKMAEKLRLCGNPIMVRVQQDSMRIDVRTLLDEEWRIVAKEINTVRRERHSSK